MLDPKMTTTQKQEELFDKYHINSGIFDNDLTIENDPTLTEEEKLLKKQQKNQSAFFSIFETATGIQMSEFDESGTLQLPEYKKSKTGIEKVFPIASSAYARITMSYGQLYSPSTVQTYALTHNNHTGIDYSVPVGTPVDAAAAGIAYTVRGNTGYGNYIKIVHDDGYTSIYAHGNGTFYVNNGERVSAGQTIMQSGNSGNSTGPHLHFEVRNPSGQHINPTSYIYESA